VGRNGLFVDDFVEVDARGEHGEEGLASAREKRFVCLMTNGPANQHNWLRKTEVAQDSSLMAQHISEVM